MEALLIGLMGSCIDNERLVSCRKSFRESWEKRWHHLTRKLFEDPYLTRDVSIAKVDKPKIERPEMPFRHDLYQPPFAEQLRLHYRRQIADARSRKQCNRQTGIVVHRDIRLKVQRFGFLSIDVCEPPAILGKVPAQEREQPMLEQILGCFG